MNSHPSPKGDVLIVDDTPDNLRLLSAMLTQQGHEVRAVINGSAALMGVQAQLPDLILLDILMPGMDGYEVCQQLKANPKTQDIPIIFISALNEVFDKVKAFSIGGADYMSKPFQVEEVLARVEHHLSRRRLERELKAQNLRLQQAETELRQALEQERLLNQKIEAMAALEERNRIARDIHDSLGHSLVALNIQMETAIALWQDAPTQAYQFLVEAKQLGSDALKAVRQSVAAIRCDPLEGQLLEKAIATLTQDFARTTGIVPTSRLQISQSLSQEVNMAIYRIIQEGLTNICKYAEATTVNIEIQSTPAGLLLILKDNGKGWQADGNTTGFGLQGMRERVTALGGHLKITTQPNAGCRITASFPQL